MAKFYYLVIILSILNSCSTSSISIPSNDSEISHIINHNYSEINQYKISWKTTFSQAKTSYFVYFYSLTCSHCEQLKNDIIEYALKNENMYFCQNSEEVIITENVYSTIGISSYEHLSILGFPSLIYIENGILKSNIAGVPNIKIVLNL